LVWVILAVGGRPRGFEGPHSASVSSAGNTRGQVGLYLDGLISAVERKTGWQLAEHAGDEAPWQMQAVLGRGFWDAEQVRDICRD
jgi:SRSO17 transposase